MDIGVTHSSSVGARIAHRTHRCPQCRTDALIMSRRYISAPGWGEPVLTEYYDCDFCDARYSYSPADARWKRIAQ
jgi:hypothetical protein